MTGGRGCLSAGWTLALLLTSRLACAEPNDYVHLPDVVAGERELDLKTGQQQQRSGGDSTATSLGMGYGVNDGWFTELYAKVARAPGESTGFDAVEWENRFLLTEPGRHPVDVGLLLEIERPTARSEGYELTWGPLLQTQSGRWQYNLNLLQRLHVHASAPWPDELRYEAQVRCRADALLDWGAQAFGSFGALRDNPAGLGEGRTHRLGPAIFGKFKTAARSAIAWNAAVLFRAGAGEPGTTLRLQAEFEF